MPEPSERFGGGFPNGSRGGPGDDVAFVNQLHGNPNYPAYQARVDASDFWSAIGRQRIEDYILSLSATLKEKLIAYWGVDALYSPREPELSSALTAFTPFPDDRKNTQRSNDFVTRLREEYGFVVRNTGVRIPGEADDRPIRISTHLFHDQTDIDQVVDAMIDLSARLRIVVIPVFTLWLTSLRGPAHAVCGPWRCCTERLRNPASPFGPGHTIPVRPFGGKKVRRTFF